MAGKQVCIETPLLTVYRSKVERVAIIFTPCFHGIFTFMRKC